MKKEMTDEEILKLTTPEQWTKYYVQHPTDLLHFLKTYDNLIERLQELVARLEKELKELKHEAKDEVDCLRDMQNEEIKMDLEKILKNLENEYGENIELVFYRDGSGHVAESGLYGVEDKTLFYFDYPSDLELKFG